MSWSSPLPPPTQCSSDHLHDNYPAKPLETVTPGWCSTSSAPPTYFTSFLNYSPDQDQGPTLNDLNHQLKHLKRGKISLLNIQSQLYENSFKQKVFDTSIILFMLSRLSTFIQKFFLIYRQNTFIMFEHIYTVRRPRDPAWHLSDLLWQCLSWIFSVLWWDEMSGWWTPDGSWTHVESSPLTPPILAWWGLCEVTGDVGDLSSPLLSQTAPPTIKYAPENWPEISPIVRSTRHHHPPPSRQTLPPLWATTPTLVMGSQSQYTRQDMSHYLHIFSSSDVRQTILVITSSNTINTPLIISFSSTLDLLLIIELQCQLQTNFLILLQTNFDNDYAANTLSRTPANFIKNSTSMSRRNRLSHSWLEIN